MSKLRLVFCALFDHSKIVHLYFGEVSCARCGAVIGDTLMGSFDLKGIVIDKHDCSVCLKVHSNFGWRNKFLAPKQTFTELSRPKDD